ncbi:hypothetical protein HNQ07_002946 [Deinococcus metalli]|uniref:Uncharacterized protein n=1 Tax=Deinococcus metalli TaxID=1141878 RepID=A0A7W8KFX0_9DEIO|nr:hypothetical protein [Deinococcus metalli]MBB5377454.1 hypothetical protein [Deinococcus metalli]GHF50532.1 hypothetical protein GCM10017781_28820 [Deinococcus metalli]
MSRTRTLALLILAGAAHAATVTPGPGPARPILPASVSGFNLGNWMPVVEHVPALNALNPATLRWPGGNIGDEQNRTPEALQTLKSTWTLLGRPPLVIQTRVYSRPGGNRDGADAKNTPADAADLVRMARGLDLTVAYWEIGNEPDLYATNRSDPSWTPEKYCGVVRAQRAAILAADPAAKIAGPAVSNPGPFLDAVIKTCGDALDLVTWHLYPSNGDGTDAEAFASIEKVQGTLTRVQGLWADPATNPLGQGRPLAQGVTEYAQSYRSDRATHLSDAVGGLWAAEAALRLSEGGAALNTYFSLMATGNHGLLDDAGYPRFSYAAFRELAHYRGETLDLLSDDPAVWVHGARQDKLITVFALNTAATSTPLTISVPGYSLVGAKAITDADVSADRPPRPLAVAAPILLPPLSLTRLVLKSSPPPFAELP